MRILLDENLNWRLGRDLPGHQVDSVPRIGWAGIQNGALLRRAAADGFEALVTMDGHMLQQQNIAGHPLAIVALRTRTNRLEDTQPLMPKLLQLLPQLRPGTLTFIDSSEE